MDAPPADPNALPHPLIIGLAGGTGSGKTTVTNAIVRRVGRERIAIIQQDAYYRDQGAQPLSERLAVNYDHPNSLETELLIVHLNELRAGRGIEMPIYDFAQFTRSPRTLRVESRPVILVEGILIFVDPALREMFDVKVFVDTDADIRFIRRLQRDITERGRTVESVIQQYLSTVRPMHLEFVEPSKRYADVIVPEGGLNTVAMDLLVAQVESMLGRQVV
jgi:uridine kinase